MRVCVCVCVCVRARGVLCLQRLEYGRADEYSDVGRATWGSGRRAGLSADILVSCIASVHVRRARKVFGDSNHCQRIQRICPGQEARGLPIQPAIALVSPAGVEDKVVLSAHASPLPHGWPISNSGKSVP
jgi:hypothetical protein